MRLVNRRHIAYAAIWRGETQKGPVSPHETLNVTTDATRKARVAAKPRAVRTPCNLPHFSIKARLSGPALTGPVDVSLLFVGMIPMSV